MPEWLAALPQYRYGWLLFGALAVLPALVSGNMLVRATERRPLPWRAMVGNGLVLLASLALIVYAAMDLLDGLGPL